MTESDALKQKILHNLIDNIDIVNEEILSPQGHTHYTLCSLRDNMKGIKCRDCSLAFGFPVGGNECFLRYSKYYTKYWGSMHSMNIFELYIYIQLLKGELEEMLEDLKSNDVGDGNK